jgi:hypothetical protein
MVYSYVVLVCCISMAYISVVQERLGKDTFQPWCYRYRVPFGRVDDESREVPASHRHGSSRNSATSQGSKSATSSRNSATPTAPASRLVRKRLGKVESAAATPTLPARRPVLVRKSVAPPPQAGSPGDGAGGHWVLGTVLGMVLGKVLVVLGMVLVVFYYQQNHPQNHQDHPKGRQNRPQDHQNHPQGPQDHF